MKAINNDEINEIQSTNHFVNGNKVCEFADTELYKVKA